MAKYSETVRKAGDKRDSSEIAKYLFELAQSFNDYYSNGALACGDSGYSYRDRLCI